MEVGLFLFYINLPPGKGFTITSGLTPPTTIPQPLGKYKSFQAIICPGSVT